MTADSATSITATSPAGTGVVDVTVTTPVGTSATSPADEFTYVPAPTVTGLSPTSGPAGVTGAVTITGTDLSGATSVKFGTHVAAIEHRLGRLDRRRLAHRHPRHRRRDRDHGRGHLGHLGRRPVHLHLAGGHHLGVQRHLHRGDARALHGHRHRPARADAWPRAGHSRGGVHFDDPTGVLSGTPTAGGTFPITFTATNGIGSPASQPFTLTVNQLPLVVHHVVVARRHRGHRLLGGPVGHRRLGREHVVGLLGRRCLRG